ncbi:MAG: hypothetical protein CTY28_09565 [Hyphomicrobium sp.]|nr:MAG: hypothetical protein CTY28_09565 [Hyphomicrobium sp.]
MLKRVNIDVVDGEFRVPGPDATEAQAYYTTDRTDAENTARIIHGRDALIRFRKRESFYV